MSGEGLSNFCLFTFKRKDVSPNILKPFVALLNIHFAKTVYDLNVFIMSKVLGM